MWQLWKTNAFKQWAQVGIFESVTDAARCIRETEEYPITGVFLQMYVDTTHGTDAEAFGHFEHTGRHALYAIKRRVH